MRRILVPLDGTPLSASILPDAKRLAGAGGTLILLRNATSPVSRGQDGCDRAYTILGEAEAYLDRLAFALRREGYDARPELFVLGTPNAAIVEGTKLFRPDMVACSTHARTAIARAVYRSVAWHTLDQSPVPVLLRHATDDEAMDRPEARSIMVPLDGSCYAERALPLACELATEWQASLVLVRVIPEITPASLSGDYYYSVPGALHGEVAEAQSYLATVQRELPGKVDTQVCRGAVVPALARVAEHRDITDVVMASHGRTGLARVFLGSVADGLIHHLGCPIIVVPALAAQRTEREVPVVGRIPVEV